MTTEQTTRSAVFWIVVVVGAAGLAITTAIVVALRFIPPSMMPISAINLDSNLAPVTGTITLDGEPLKSAVVTFIPIGDSANRIPLMLSSIGMTDEDGNFALAYMNDENGKPIKGAKIGLHRVQIVGSDQTLPEKYSTTESDLKAEVHDRANRIDFALQSQAETLE